MYGGMLLPLISLRADLFLEFHAVWLLSLGVNPINSILSQRASSPSSSSLWDFLSASISGRLLCCMN